MVSAKNKNRVPIGKVKSLHFENVTATIIAWLTVTEYLCHRSMTTGIFRLSQSNLVFGSKHEK